MAVTQKFSGLMTNGADPIRLTGTLAVGVVIPNNTILTQRILVGGITSLIVRAKGSSVSGTPKLDIKAVLSDGKEEVGTGTQAATGNMTQATLTTSEVTGTFTPNGARYADVIITCAVTDAYTITYVDLFAVPVYG